MTRLIDVEAARKRLRENRLGHRTSERLLAEVERSRVLLRRVEPELAPNYDEARALADKFGMEDTGVLISEIREHLSAGDNP